MNKQKNTFSSTKDTFICLAMITGIVIVIGLLALLLISNNYYSQYGDDHEQYFPIMYDFVIRLKSGNLSFFSFSNYLGSSYFVDTYYVSFDIFTLITVVLSNFISFKFVFGFVELIKLFFGVMAFAYYLYLRKRSNKAIFFTSLIYMIAGANVILQAFPIYYSLIFYIPLVAVTMEHFKRGKKFILPIVFAMLIFYDYYNAYMLILFAFMILIIQYFIDKKINKQALIDLSKEVLKFTLLGLLGVMMGMVVLIPSAFAILNDTTKGGSFSLDSISDLIYFSDPTQYLRTIGEILTPTLSTDYWGFSNNGWLSYVNMHLSLYITVSGLLIALNVYMIKGKESLIYKILLPIEIIMIFMPIWYMIFSGSTGTYTRWFALLNFINLMVLSFVINETNFDFYKMRYKILIRNIVVFVIVLLITNIYIQKIYSSNLITYITHFGNLPITFDVSPSNTLNLSLDVIFLLVAAFIVVLGTIACFVRKVKIMPYLLSCELLIGVVFMYMAPFRVSNYMLVGEKQAEVNNYLNEYLPYSNSLYRIFLDNNIDNGGGGQNFNRSNLQFTTFKNFHSWHTAASHELTNLLFGTDLDNNASHLLDNAYFDLQQMLGTKYVLTYHDKPVSLPYNYNYSENLSNENFDLYENQYYVPFTVYDTYMNYDNIHNENTGKNTLSGTKYVKSATLLNYLYYTGDNNEIRESLNVVHKNTFNIDKHTQTFASKTGKYDTVSDGYYVYNLDFTNEEIPETGMFNFYYGTSGNVPFGYVNLTYNDESGNYQKVSCSGSEAICYYSKKNTNYRIHIQATTELIKRNQEGKSMKLTSTFYDYSYIDDFYAHQNEYTDKNISVYDSKIDISYKTENDDSVVILVPVAYSKNWKASNDYDVLNVNGGLIGVYIPKGSGSDISFTLSFEAQGLKTSALLSATGFMIYGGYLIYEFKIKKKEENQ